MALPYPDTVTVTRAVSGVSTAVFTGRADVQDGKRYPEIVVFTAASMSTAGIAEGDTVAVTYADASTVTGTVDEADRLDDKLRATTLPDTAAFTVAGTTGGSVDAESGQTVGGTSAPTTLYSGAAYVYGDRLAVVRAAGGDADVAGEAFVQLPDVPLALEQQQEDAEGVLTFGTAGNRVTRACRVVSVQREKRRLVVTWAGLPEAA